MRLGDVSANRLGVRDRMRTTMLPSRVRPANPLSWRPPASAPVEGAARLGFSLADITVLGDHPVSIQRKCSSCAAEEDKVQAKLSVSRPNDPLEQEADRFAEQVIQGHAPVVSHGAAPAVQRDALEEAVEEADKIEDDEADTMPQGRGTGMLFAKRERETPAALPAHSIPQREGQPLEPNVRRFMRERTGFDFAYVRIHADAEAAASASRLAARAYTVGSNIYFDRGQYQPESHEGRTLLAHELAHVVQQSRGWVQPRLKVRPADDPHEREADAITRRVRATPAGPVSGTEAEGGSASSTSTEQPVLRSNVEDEERTIQARRLSSPEDIVGSSRHTHGPGMELAASASELASGGNPLPEATRQFYEARMGHDFSAVRLHHGVRANQLNGAISARAFTYRNHVWLGPNEGSAPSFTLGHELVHVMQQTSPGGQGPASASAAPPSIQRRLLPPGNCIQGIHDIMQRAVKAWCDHPSGRTCTSGESCGRLLQKIRRNQLCARNRRTINDTCYEGGDEGHRIAERDARRAQANCMALFRASCTPRPVPQPERQPERTPERTTPQVDRSFLDRMAAITGLTGTALIVYLIISEGSRLFPPRNLIPVP